MKRSTINRPRGAGCRELRWVLAGILLLGLGCARGFIYHPMPGLTFTPRNAGMEYEDARLEATDGVRLHGWWIPAGDERGVILFCHGNAGNLSHRLEILRLFHDLGFSTLAFDYRGYGRSQGSPGEEGLYLDADAAWDFVVNQKKKDPSRVLIYGRSLGGPVAAHLAAQSNPGGLVLDSTFTSLLEAARTFSPNLSESWIKKHRYPTREFVSRVHCPVLVIHSQDDLLVPFSLGKSVYEAAGEPKFLVPVRGDHNLNLSLSKSLYAEALDEFAIRFIDGGVGLPGSVTL